MNSFRQSLKDLKPTLEKISVIKPILAQCRPILFAGCFLWILGGLLPDTAHFAVTFFSSLGRLALFAGLFFAFVQGEYKFIMIISTVISIGAFIIIIVELAAPVYLSSFETYIFLMLFLSLAVNTSKYIKHVRLYGDSKDNKPIEVPPDYFTQISTEENPVVHIESIPYDRASKAAEPANQPDEFRAEPVEQKSPPDLPEYKPEIMGPAPETEAADAPAQSKPDPFEIKRAPSIGSAPSVGRAPSIGIKPKE